MRDQDFGWEIDVGIAGNIAGIWAGYFGTHLVGLMLDGSGPSASGLLVLGLATALGGVGFADDLIKIRRSRNLGLNKTGLGTLTLSAANTYTGPTTVNGGTLLVNGSITSPVTVYAGTLGEGLLVYDRASGRWRRSPAALPSSNATALAAAAGAIYIGTDNGLVRIPEESIP